jgi:4-amino-4-deoxy-L-arabinose transferase-like glycosyltransferase
MHAPGYVILLAAAMRVFGHGRSAAVALNALFYLGGALLARVLALRLGAGRWTALAAGVLLLFLPVYLPYVFWVLPEVVVGVLALASLAAIAGAGTAAAIVAGLLLGAGFLVRESLLFVVPAAVLLSRSLRRALLMLGVFCAFTLLVYVPLSEKRGEGGTNFWRTTRDGNAIAFDVLHEAGLGRLTRAARIARTRAVQTIELLAGPNVTSAERGILALYAGIAVLPILHLRRRSPAQKRLFAGLALGMTALLTVMLAFFDVPPWSAPRYLMLLVPPLLVFVARADAERPTQFGAAIVTLLASVLLDAGTRTNFDRYIESRRRRQEARATYLEQYIGQDAKRVFANDSYLFGLRRYPLEVIVALPSPEQMMALERQLRLDYVVLPIEWEGRKLFDQLPRYELVNRDEVLAEQTELRIYRRTTP